MLPNSLVPQHRRGSGFRISGKKKEGWVGHGGWGVGGCLSFQALTFRVLSGDKVAFPPNSCANLDIFEHR